MDQALFPKEGGVIYKRTYGNGDQRYSEEALKVIENIVDCLEKYYPSIKDRKTELAIISPYRDTVKILQRFFQTDHRKIDLTVETIDRIQGVTVDYTILYIPQTEVKFALEERRFNVATSRSRSTTLILSDIPLDKMSSLHGKVKIFITKVISA
jgi:superfamily I DNA and/or RNA helicase